MRINTLGAVFVLALVGVSLSARGEEGFSEAMSAEAVITPGYSRGGAWHRGQRRAAGLGFEVACEGWPRLLQRGFIDNLDRLNGTREVASIAGYIDLGLVRSIAGALEASVKSREVKSTWCYRLFEVRDGALKYYVSRLTPAMLFVTDSNGLDLFAGRKYIGERWDDAGRRKKLFTELVPAHAAFVSGGETVVSDTDEPVALDRLDEPWVLLWYGEASPFLRTRAPNMLFRTPPLRRALRSGEYFAEVDVPVLVVFGGQPKELRRAADALRVTFSKEGRRRIALLPLLGQFHPDVSRTRLWANHLPDDVVARCRAWSRRLKSFPLGCAESWRIADDGAVTIRERFAYLNLSDGPETALERTAPVPPVVAIAQRYGLPIDVSGEAAPIPIPTHSGPYSVLMGTDTVTFTINGLVRYVREAVNAPAPASPDAEWLRQELRDEIKKMLEAGLLAPAYNFGAKHASRAGVHFLNPGETIVAMSEALAYLDRPTREAATRYMLEEIRRRDPLRTGEPVMFAGTRREYGQVVDPATFTRMVGKGLTGRVRSSLWNNAHTLADNAYALWLLGHATGRWDVVRRFWPDLKKMAHPDAGAPDWATCGFLGPTNANPGSVQATNGRFARYVGLARLGERFNDEPTRRLAMFNLARAALLRFAQGKLMRYLYDYELAAVERDDWMDRLSTAPGESGASLLWTGRWAGAENDVRQVIRWDQFGPVVGQLDNLWTAVFPPFQNLQPETGRFLGDHLAAEVRSIVATVERNAPDWFITRRLAHLGKEQSTENPVNGYSIFMAKAYALNADGRTMLRYYDIPAFRVGDLYHLRRLVATLRGLGKWDWKELESSKRK